MEDIVDKSVGCEHYRRKSKFVTPCCGKVYVCRFCHDECEAHVLDRKAVSELVCACCGVRQEVRETCENCSVRFGKYACLECKLFDDDEKEQYHCDGCGICRVGGRDKYFHCSRCNMCLPRKLVDNHRCIENVSRSNCPVCLEHIHTSRIPCHIPSCGHLLHRPCFEQMVAAGMYSCPSCGVCLFDMSSMWHYLDNEVEMTPMPDEYDSYMVQILCKDCHQESVVKFHVVGLKCTACGSYNTCRVSDCADVEAAGAGSSDAAGACGDSQ
ncbi:RING finger and CHY zinc finger domain-containing protein 1 isoform X2 [Bacillus rossius redtenbacheri]|uniref:RING finger and CHY zinc finger domain-containing protein 1 isoform X2 n=1 Tax=Bacillus rossius redtenbacheri TaxID=93214 RepID=UPI002FDDDE20